MICDRCKEKILRDGAKKAAELHMLTMMMDCVLQIVSITYRVPMDELRGRNREQHVAFARQVFMHLARRLTKASLPGIGRYLNRDHSTCHHAVVLVGNRRERDKPFDSLMLKLEAEIKEEMAAWQSNLMPTKSPDASLLTPAL